MSVTWGGNATHPNPSTIEEQPDFVGGAGVMADGSLVIDTIITKKRIKVAWEGLTEAQADALYAIAILYVQSAMTLTAAGGGSYGNVLPIPNSALKTNVATYPVTYKFSVEVRTT